MGNSRFLHTGCLSRMDSCETEKIMLVQAFTSVAGTHITICCEFVTIIANREQCELFGINFCVSFCDDLWLSSAADEFEGKGKSKHQHQNITVSCSRIYSVHTRRAGRGAEHRSVPGVCSEWHMMMAGYSACACLFNNLDNRKSGQPKPWSY